MGDNVIHSSPCCNSEDWEIEEWWCRGCGKIFRNPFRIEGDREYLLKTYQKSCTTYESGGPGMFVPKGKSWVEVCPRCRSSRYEALLCKCGVCGDKFWESEMIEEFIVLPEPVEDADAQKEDRP
jgi:hypothetical protein